MTIPADAPVGNDQVKVKNLNDNSFSNQKYFGVYSASCGVIKGKLTNSAGAVGSDQNNVPVRLESWNTIYGETKSHNNGYYAVVGYSGTSCQTGSFDVFFTTPAGATEAAPSHIGSQTVTAGSVTNAGAKAFAAANVTGYVKGPVGTADENIGMNAVTVNIYNDYGTVKQKAITNKNGLFKAYVPTPNASNYYTVETDPHPFYGVSPYLYTRGRISLNISQGGSALNQTIRFAAKNVQGTVKTPAGEESASNPHPNTAVPNAHIGIHTQNWSVSEWTNTASDGTFGFGVSAGSDYILEVEPPFGDANFGVYSKNTYSGLTISTSTNLDTVISGGPRLGIPNVFGRVMAGGSPLSGAYTHLDKEGYWSGMNSNADGKFSFTVS